MDSSERRLIRGYFAAQMINHYYWVHTDGDDPDGKISIENVQRIVARVTGLQISKFSIPFDGATVHANVEREPGSVRINIRGDLPEEGKRFSAIKEIFHLLADDDCDFSTDVVKNLGDLVAYQQKALDGEASEGLRSEFNAEAMTLEIIYPFEYRDSDRNECDCDEDFERIANKRGVPVYWVKRALSSKHIERSRRIWNLLPLNLKFPPLPAEGVAKNVRIRLEEVPPEPDALSEDSASLSHSPE